MNFKNYFDELKRRNVFKAALAYIVVSWIIIQVASIAFPTFGVQKFFLKGIFILLILGFPVWLIFAWIYEITPEGLKKTENVEREKSITHETSNKFNKLIIGALVVAIILLGANLYSNYSIKEEKPKTNLAVNDSISSNNKTKEKSIAVLAFEDMSPNRDQEYFSDGMSDEILNQLTRNPELKVVSRTSSFYFKDKDFTTEEIGKKLHVNYLLEGAVRKADTMVRISAQLINSSSGIHIWSETYDRKLDDIFKIQGEIAEAVAKKLEVSLLGENVKEVNTQAYILYLKANHLWNQANSESLKNAMALLKEANSIDSLYAPIWELMSEIYMVQGYVNLDLPVEKAYQLGHEAAKISVEIDPDYAKGYIELARWAQVQFDFIKAKAYLTKAMELQPKNPAIIRRRAFLVFDSLPEMIRENKKALELDPLAYDIHYYLGLFYFFDENYKEAIKEMDIYEEYQKGSGIISSMKAMILLKLGKTEEASEEIKKEPEAFFKSMGNIMVVYQTGKKGEASLLLKEFINTYPKKMVNIADIYAFMGDREKTFEWLWKAVEAEDADLTEGVYHPFFRKFQDDLRWQQILEAMGVPEDNGIPGYKHSS